jgi:hypothetical protein
MGLNSTIDLGRQRFHRTDFHKLSFDRRLLEVIIASSDITPSEIWRTINLGGMGLIGIVMSKGSIYWLSSCSLYSSLCWVCCCLGIQLFGSFVCSLLMYSTSVFLPVDVGTVFC